MKQVYGKNTEALSKALPISNGVNVEEKTYRILFLGRVLLGLIFAYSGFTKLMEPVENFQGAMANYEIIPYILVPFLARVVPWIEFLFGAFLFVGYLPRISALVLAVMSWSFIMLILTTRIVTGRLPADCGCFGEGSIIHLAPLQIFILDCFNLVIGLKLFLVKNHPCSLDAAMKQKS